jgi:hypothetical protein
MQHSSTNNRDFLLALITLAAIVGAFIVNFISNIFPLGGLSIGEISNTLFKDVLIIPANYAFAIWGLIYLGLFAFGIYQFLPAQRSQPDLRTAGYLLVIASIAQSIWVYLFLSRLFTLSIVAMLMILLPLIACYLKLGIGKSVSRMKKWCVHIPISIYLGWISVATIVNVACDLYIQGWSGWGISPQVWTIIMMFVATIIAALISLRGQDIAFPGVIIWAITAIAIKQWYNPTLKTVAILCAIALIFVVFARNLYSRIHN